MNLIDEINKEIRELNGEKKIGFSATLPEAAKELINEQIVPPKRKRGRPPKVSNEIFVEMWGAALINGSLPEVAASLGISPASCAVKASNMRKAGFNLPQFKRGRPKKVS
tara:strand:- start:438 stop:767 length:330 start_codon:yes stop_codon:yes gene_type:complete